MAVHEQEKQQEDDDAPAQRSPLPHKVVTEILAYLPAKSAGRFRCVSRSWQATLSSAHFLELHLRRANYQEAAGRPKLFFGPTDEPSDDYFFYAWQPGGAVTKLMGNGLLLPAPLTKPLHGLVLLRCVRSGGYYICNPSTGAVLPLPDSRVPSKKTSRYPLPYYMDVVYGLGYCSATHRYKAVRIFSKEEVNSVDAPCCDVFVLGGDTPAYWLPATSKPPMCVVTEANPAVFLNGHLHFLCRYDGGILTFNVRDETFGSLPLPPCPLGKDPLSLRTTELDGCLCVFLGGGGGDPCYVWLLRDYKAQRWEQLCCIDRAAWPEPQRTQLQSRWMAPLCLSNGANGSKKKIMFGTGTCKVFAVDLNGGGVPEILFRPEEAIAGSFHDTYDDYPALGLFEESLVPVGRDVEEMVSSSPVMEAWFHVLKWLPARSVSRLSLVSRAWRAMITTNSFIRSHAAVHATRPRIKFVLDPLVGSFSDLDEHMNNTFLYGLPLDNPVQCSQPCHGLNLGRWSFGDYLYNPTLGVSERIEQVKRDAVLLGRSIALGYDSEVEDHVIVSLAYEEKNMATREYKLRCDARWLRTDDDWCPHDPPPRPVALDVPPAYVNGKIYWVVEPMLGPESAVCELLAFDVINGEFKVMHGPSWSSHGGGRTSILELYGAISMAWFDEDKNVIDVWKIKDIMDGAWCVGCRIELDKFSPQYSSREVMLMCADTIDGRILLNTGRSLGYYDPKTAALETIYTVGKPQGYRGFSATTVQDSLVRPFMKWWW
ncbi:hypothetical protein VPH35_033933 [Triticum aestivum]|uniref:F-box domain-containing protein n=1 Tax=Triticum aestivum TaxID=4565 RepID=A0A3B6D556_WHEAT